VGILESGRDRPTGRRPSDQPDADHNQSGHWRDHHADVADNDADVEDDDADQSTHHDSGTDDHADDFTAAHNHHNAPDHDHHVAGRRRYWLLTGGEAYQTPGSILQRT
jgi:hypothetical protein